MGKKNKVYEPGELTRVRQNLGNLTPEEARKMGMILGGEVGEEKEEYPLLKESAPEWKRPPRPVETVPSREEVKPSRLKPSIEKKGQFSFADRVRIDFLCSRREFGIKSFKEALGSLFSFMLPVPDRVNPGFIRSLDLNVLNPVTSLVRCVRRLFSRTKENVFNEIISHSFYRSILQTLKDWNIETLEREYQNLRRNIREKDCRNFTRFCFHIYRPLMILSRLEEDGHILGALKWAYECNMKEAKENRSEKNRIISLFYEGEKSLPLVIQRVKKILYPLLLKLVSHSFYHYDEFFHKELDHIFLFLELNESQLIPPPSARKSPPPPPREVKEENSEKTPEPGEEIEETPEKVKVVPTEVLKGFGLLERLYPQGGWEHPEVFPDFYPYFQPLFHYPSGFELIPPGDPLHQEVILLSVVNDLFYGFRHIKFGQLRDMETRGEYFNIHDKSDTFIGIWPLYLDEVIAKSYISRLQDYCRQIEKDRGFKKSEVANKIISELDWIKKSYLLPHHIQKLPIRGTGIVKRKVPPLFEVVTDFRKILSRVVQETKNKEPGERLESIANPWAKYQFDVSNNTSKQLDKILVTKTRTEEGKVKIIDKRNNANLLYYTLGVLNILYYLLHDRESHFYNAPGERIFRSVHDSSDIPQYTVNTLNPFMMMEELKNPDDEIEEIPERELPLARLVEKRREKFKKQGISFAVVFCRLEGYNESDTFSPRDVIKTQLDLSRDLVLPQEENEFVVILEGRTFNQLIAIIRALTRVFQDCRLCSGLIQYQLNWRGDYFIRILERVKEFTHNLEEGKIVYLDIQNKKFKSIAIGG